MLKLFVRHFLPNGRYCSIEPSFQTRGAISFLLDIHHRTLYRQLFVIMTFGFQRWREFHFLGKDSIYALAAFLLLCCTLLAEAPTSPLISATENGISYYDAAILKSAPEYQKEFCKLDISYPINRSGFATIIWFHGGGLTAGGRHFIKLEDKGIAQVAVDYRLSPKAQLPSFLDDAAASTAWVMRHIQNYGGDPKKVFVAGHSAGGYLAAMIGMDARWLAQQGASNQQLAGIIPVSGQVSTHFLVKKLRGDSGAELRPIIDEYAPLYYASKELPPICLIVGDRRVEYKNRTEENCLLAAALRNVGHPHVEFYEMGGLDHVSVLDGAEVIIPKFVKSITDAIDQNSATR